MSSLRRRGAVLLSAEAYEKLQSASSRPRPLETIEPLAAKEAVRVLQMEAPDRLLAAFPRDVQFSQGGLGQPELWSSHPMGLGGAVALLESTIAKWRDSTAPVSLEPERDDGDALVFGLDWPPTYEWKPLVIEANGAALRFGGGWVAGRG